MQYKYFKYVLQFTSTEYFGPMSDRNTSGVNIRRILLETNLTLIGPLLQCLVNKYHLLSEQGYEKIRILKN